jgi:hypothetical protein
VPTGKPTRRATVVALAATALIAAPAAALTLVDFGEEREQALQAQADDLFGGIDEPLSASAETVANAFGEESLELTSGLEVEDVLSGDTEGDAASKLGQNADMIAVYPSDSRPQWGHRLHREEPFRPGVQRIRLRGRNRGKVETLLTARSPVTASAARRGTRSSPPRSARMAGRSRSTTRSRRPAWPSIARPGR